MSDAPTNTPKALPAPNKIKFGFWHGFILHAAVTIGILVVFWSLIPRLFPMISEAPNQWAAFEKKLQKLEHSLVNLGPSTPPDLSHIEAALAHLEQKLKEYPASPPPHPQQDGRPIIQLGYLLRLDHAFTMGQGYEYFLNQLSKELTVKPENYPQLLAHQTTGFETLPAIIEKLKEQTLPHESAENIPLPDHIWSRPFEKFVKVRKYTTQEKQISPLHQILILIAQNKLDEALEEIKKTGINEDVPGVKDIRILIEGRRELEKLWKEWESAMPLHATEEKIP